MEAKSRAEQQKEQEAAIRAANEKLAAQQAAEGEGGAGEDGEGGAAPAPTEEERRQKRLEDGIGIPQIIVDCAVEKQPTAVVLQSPRLPSVEEVRTPSQNTSLQPNENEIMCFVHFTLCICRFYFFPLEMHEWRILRKHFIIFSKCQTYCSRVCNVSDWYLQIPEITICI